MDTWTNGQKWTDAWIAGQKVSEIWRNGVKIYESVPYVPSQYTLTNMLSNGSFEDSGVGITGWTGVATPTRIAVPSPVHGEYGSWCGQVSSSSNQNTIRYIARSSALSVVSGRKYYIRLQCRDTGNNLNWSLYNNTTAFSPAISGSLTANTWGLADGIWTANSSTLTFRIQFASTNNPNTTRTHQIDNVMVIDLTTPFGAGNEPDAATMRSIIAANNGYWDGAQQIML